MFKIILLTSLVTTKMSYSAGDIIECENDHAWSMINDKLGKLEGNKKPKKPKFVQDAEDRAEFEALQLEEKQAGNDAENASYEEREEALKEREKALEERILALEENAKAK